MNQTTKNVDTDTARRPTLGGAAGRSNAGVGRVFAVFVAVLSFCYWKPLFDLVRYAFQVDLFSHVLLVPAITSLLIWLRRKEIPATGGHSYGVAAVLAACGLAGIAAYFVLRSRGVVFEVNDYLALAIASFVCLLAAGALAILGIDRVRVVAFPAALMVFMIPFPAFLRQWIEAFLQHASADVVHWVFNVTGMPVLRDGLVFELPGIRIQVSEECSGIRSSLALFITSLIAGYLFLRSPWRRVVLTAAVIPLGILRNAIRIYVISILSVEVDPSMIDSVVHRKGGPLFFVVSLALLAVLLLWLWKSESRIRGEERKHVQ